MARGNAQTVQAEKSKAWEQKTSASSSDQGAREITLKATILGLLLAILLCASTTYVGLKVGRTIAGSIPAAVLSILILRWFRNTHILEHNIVQTAASAGEVVSAGVIFTVPALVMIGYWPSFSYLETTAIVMIGGFLGVAFSIPLRRIMIIEKKLPYPEGIATAEVLKAGNAEHGGRMLITGGLLSAIVAVFQEVFHIFSNEWQAWKRVGSSVVGFGIEFSPVLLGAGYIVGLGITLPILFGGMITWIIGIPLYGAVYGLPEVASGQVLDSVLILWKTKFRYIGVGAMLIGGLWGVYSIAGSVRTAIQTALQAGPKSTKRVDPKDQDIPMRYVLRLTALMAIPLYILFNHVFQNAHLPLSAAGSLIVPIFCVVLSLIFGFITASIGAYMTGIVGSTCLPISGITISALLIFSLMLLALLSGQVDFHVNKDYALAASGATIIFGAIIALSSSLSSDNMQDLKAGHLVGATPWKQQFMLMVGVVAAGLVIAPILQLLYTAYGFGDSLPRPDMNPAAALAAPQATLMATVAKGIFAGNIQWDMVTIGAFIGVFFIALDQWLSARGSSFQIPVLSVALGIYLPITYVMPLVLGSVVSYLVDRKRGKKRVQEQGDERGDRLFAAGMIAGHALVGIAIAVPLAQGFDFKRISPDIPHTLAIVLGIGAFSWLMRSLYKIGVQDLKSSTR